MPIAGTDNVQLDGGRQHWLHGDHTTQILRALEYRPSKILYVCLFVISCALLILRKTYFRVQLD